jgi:hypothetical protein
MPPRSLEESLQSLLALDLIEMVGPAEAPQRLVFPVSRRRSGQHIAQWLAQS